MLGVARFGWSTEQGGHGPLVLVTGLWLLWRETRTIGRESAPDLALPAIGIASCLAVFVLARIAGILEIEAFMMYGALLFALYAVLGKAFMKAAWFPLVYMALCLPPPDQVVAFVTQPLKIGISETAVNLLHAVGYPIAGSGVTIQIAQYELLVAAACAGLNSIVSLTAICLFYIYLRHGSRLAPFVAAMLFVLPVAALSNFVRVLLLILVTYYMGEAAAQGFLHDFAGLSMFAAAIVTTFLIDAALTRWVYGR